MGHVEFSQYSSWCPRQVMHVAAEAKNLLLIPSRFWKYVLQYVFRAIGPRHFVRYHSQLALGHVVRVPAVPISHDPAGHDTTPAPVRLECDVLGSPIGEHPYAMLLFDPGQGYSRSRRVLNSVV
eukprot:jgi/Botrbrau1/19584/Bobra.0035s0067.1